MSIERTIRNWAKQTKPTAENQKIIFETMVQLGISTAEIEKCGFDVSPDSSLKHFASELHWQESVVELECHCLRNGLDYLEGRNIPDVQKCLRQVFLEEFSPRLNRLFPHSGSYQDAIYVQRHFDQSLLEFFQSDSTKNVLMVVNSSGVGKTTSLLYQANRLSLEGNPVLFLTGSEFQSQACQKSPTICGAEVLASALNIRYGHVAHGNPGNPSVWQKLFGNAKSGDAWSELNEYLRKTNRDGNDPKNAGKRRLFVFIDAIDRFNGIPEDLWFTFAQVLEFLSRFDQFKILVSCRREVWTDLNLAEGFSRHNYLGNKIVNNRQENRVDFHHIGSCPMEQDTIHGGFSRAHFESALKLHSQHFAVNLSTSEYSDSFFEIARHPLFMRLFFESNRGKTVSLARPPRIWTTYFRFMGKKRNQFRQALCDRMKIDLRGNLDSQRKLDEVCTRFVLQVAVFIFCNRKTEMDRDEISDHLLAWWKTRRGLASPASQLPLNDQLMQFLMQELPQELPDEVQIIDPQVLITYLLNDASMSGLLKLQGTHVRFDFDWYFEFSLGRAIGNAFLAKPDMIPRVIAAIETAYRRDPRSVLESLQFAVLHCEFADVSDVYLRALQGLAKSNFDFQKVACQTVNSLGIVQDCVSQPEEEKTPLIRHDDIFTFSPRFDSYYAKQQQSQLARRQLLKSLENEIESILANSVESVADKGDFVCRFELKKTLQTLRSRHASVVDRLLDRWCLTAPLRGNSRPDKLKYNSLLLRLVVGIDVLRDGSLGDLALLQRVLVRATPEDPEWQFWSRRFAAVSINQILCRANTSIDTSHEPQLASLLKTYRELLGQELNDVEEAMLIEQFVQFLDGKRCDLKTGNRWIDAEIGDFTSCWGQVVWCWVVLFLNNRWVRTASIPDDHHQFIEWVQKTQELIKQRLKPGELGAARASLDVFMNAVDRMINQPRQEIGENDFEFSATNPRDWLETDQPKWALGFSPEFLTAYHLNHHECRERLYQVVDRLELASQTPTSGLYTGRLFEPSRASEVDLRNHGSGTLPIHNTDYIERVRMAALLDSNSPKLPEVEVRPGSWGAALRSAGALKDAFDFVQKTSEKVVLCLNRPPGHLAENQICIFDNIAVGVRHAQKQMQANGVDPRVLVIDLDAHHGKHIQQTFYGDSQVAYFSLHQNNVHPGSGFAEEIGQTRLAERPFELRGLGTTCNLPMAPFTQPGTYAEFLHAEMFEVLSDFCPHVIFVALGVDADFREPFAALELTPQSFFSAGRLIRRSRGPDVPVICSFEGGFAVCSGAIADCVEAFALGLVSDDDLPDRLANIQPNPNSTVTREFDGEQASSVRSVVCRDVVQDIRCKSLNILGTVETVLDSKCQIEGLKQFVLSESGLGHFGLGAGSCLDDAKGAIDDIGELVLIGDYAFCQSPTRQTVAKGQRVWTPFLVHWSGTPHMWMHFRFHQPCSLRHLVESLDHALDIDCATIGICGFVRTKNLVEKRLSRSPAFKYRSDLNTNSTQLPFVLRPENFETFFTSDRSQMTCGSNVVIASGLMFRNLLLPESFDRLNAAFYQSPLSSRISSGIRYHVHGLILPESTPLGAKTDFCADDLRKVSQYEPAMMATHLEDTTTVIEAHLGITFLNL